MKDDTALVSIVIPAYQAEKVLNRCIASILAQTYSNFECILIDDGSTDETPAICKQFAAQDHRIRFLQQKNSGPSVARNNGIRQAQGKYLLFVDADDWIEPQTCAVLIDLAELKILLGRSKMILSSIILGLNLLDISLLHQTLYSVGSVR